MNVLSTYVVACATALVCTVQAVAAPHIITLEEGQQKTWAQSRSIKRAATGNDAVVGINVVPPRGVIITAKKAGSAMVSVWDEGESGQPSTQFQIIVTPPLAGTQKSLSTETNQAQLAADGPKLRLSGALSSMDSHAAITDALTPADGKLNKSLVDTSTTNFDVQVRMDIKIVEVSRHKLKEAGFYYQRNHYAPDGSFAGSTGFSNPGNYSGFTKEPGQGYVFQSTSGFIPYSDAFNIFSVSDNVWAAFSALEANGFAYSLAEPSLTALSGQTATFLAGGEIPIPFKSGSDGSISVSFKEFGIRLGLTPTVHDNQRITMRVAPEVSEVDSSLSVQSGGYAIPGLRVRRTETTVSIGDGETFIISGLVSRQTSAAIDKFPFLGDIPILGAFFKSDRFERADKELLMIATPHLVRPFAKNAKLPALPGEEVRHYDPGFMHMFLKETGRFAPSESGFSE